MHVEPYEVPASAINLFCIYCTPVPTIQTASKFSGCIIIKASFTAKAVRKVPAKDSFGKKRSDSLCSARCKYNIENFPKVYAELCNDMVESESFFPKLECVKA